MPAPRPGESHSHKHLPEVAAVQQNESYGTPIAIYAAGPADLDIMCIRDEPSCRFGRSRCVLAFGCTSRAITGLRRVDVFEPDPLTRSTDLNRIAIDDTQPDVVRLL